MSNNIKQQQIELQEKNGFKIVHENEYVTVMKDENGKYIKVDDDGMVVSFRPLNENLYN